jgi:uncharacterized protein (TIGR04255 family)
MPFPESPRVIYSNNPLVEVLCQLRFDQILRLETEVPAQFQDLIRRDYPKLKKRHELQLSVGGESAKSSTTIIYDFISPDEDWRIALSSTFITLATTDYIRWEDFKNRLLKVFDAFTRVYDVDSFTRIGLRYKDIIDRSKLGLQDVDWSGLLMPHIACMYDEPIVQEYLQDTQTISTFQLRVDDSRARLRHGLGQNTETEDEVFIIDSDFFRESPTLSNDVFRFLDEYNRRARRLFRWCITEKLHEAMEPQDPS